MISNSAVGKTSAGLDPTELSMAAAGAGSISFMIPETTNNSAIRIRPITAAMVDMGALPKGSLGERLGRGLVPGRA